MAEYQTFIINKMNDDVNSDFRIDATTYLNITTQTYLTELAGWDDTDITNITTNTNILGAGSFPTSTQIKERVITVSLDFYDNTGDFNVYNNLKNIKSWQVAFTPMQLTFRKHTVKPDTSSQSNFQNSASVYKEIINNALIQSTTWVQLDDHASMDIVLLCPSPLKTVYVNDSQQSGSYL